MRLFMGRYNPSLLWNANVQRSASPALDPIFRLADGELELRGVENGTIHELKFTFGKIESVSPSSKTGGVSREDSKRLPPMAGLVRTCLDNKIVKNGKASMHLNAHRRDSL